MIHQLHRRLLLGNFNVFHKFFFCFVAGDLHNSDGWDVRQIHICCSAAACRMGLYQIAFLDDACFLLAVFDGVI